MQQQKPNPPPAKGEGNGKSAGPQRRELSRVWFVKSVTLEKGKVVEYLESPASQGKPDVQLFYAGGPTMTVEWGEGKAKKVRAVPLTNVISFVPKQDE